jgi:hypothetical protein
VQLHHDSGRGTDITSIAQAIAAAHPTAMLPCPVCGATTNGANLGHHLARVHGAEVTGAVGPAGLVMRGRDHRVRPWIVVLPIVVAALGVSGQRLVGSASSASLWPVIAATLVFVVLVVVSSVRGFPARLVVDRASLTLRHSWGCGSRSVDLPAPVDVGGVWERGARMDTANDFIRSFPRRLGGYVRIGGRRGITIGCESVRELRKSWTGWAPGPKKRSRDIVISRAQLATLQYVLADARVLRPAAT